MRKNLFIKLAVLFGILILISACEHDIDLYEKAVKEYIRSSSKIKLTANTWTDGNLPTSSDVQWFKFTATASMQYIHVSFGTMTNLSVKVFYSSGDEVKSAYAFYDSSGNKSVTMTVTVGQEYFLIIEPYSSSDTGTYKIMFNTTFIPPGTIQLTANTWADCNLPTSSDEQWFKFTATAETQYIHVSFSTLTDLYVQVYDSSGATVGSETWLYSSNSSTRYVSMTVTLGQEYYIKVKVRRPSSYSGTYRIGFNTSSTPPS